MDAGGVSAGGEGLNGEGTRDWGLPLLLSSRVSGESASVGIYSPCAEAGHYALKAENDGLTVE